MVTAQPAHYADRGQSPYALFISGDEGQTVLEEDTFILQPSKMAMVNVYVVLVGMPVVRPDNSSSLIR